MPELTFRGRPVRSDRALIMGIMNMGMSILGVGIDYQQMIKGLVLLAAA